MYKRVCICSAILIIALALSATPVLGIKVTVNGERTTSMTKCHLDDSAQLNEKTLGSSGVLYQELEVSGSGENSLTKSASGDCCEVVAAFDATGTVNSQMSAMTSSDLAGINSKVEMSGNAGCIALTSSAEENNMAALGFFSGEGGYLSSDMTSIASDRSFVGGSANILGVNCLNEEISNNVASGGDVFMKLDGLYGTSSGNLGDFGMLAINSEKSNAPRGRTRPPSSSSDPVLDDPSSYKLAGWKWEDNSSIQLYLRSDRYLSGEGLTSTQAKDAISGAAETWDAAVTKQDLFNDKVIVSSTAKADRYDGKNVHAWKPISSTAIAYARTYYYPKIYVRGADGENYWEAIESDVCYNTRYGWSTSGPDKTPYTKGDKIDVQSVALHELGHTLGLGDIYGTDFAGDTSQIMNSYNDIQWTLGSGDKAGIQKLYGQ